MKLLYASMALLITLASLDMHAAKNSGCNDEYHYLRHKLYKNITDLKFISELKDERELYILIIERHIRRLNKKISKVNLIGRLSVQLPCIDSLFSLLSAVFIEDKKGSHKSIENYFRSGMGSMISVGAYFGWQHYKDYYELKLKQDEHVLRVLNALEQNEQI